MLLKDRLPQGSFFRIIITFHKECLYFFLIFLFLF